MSRPFSVIAIAFALALASATADPAMAAGRVALVIGNSAYQHVAMLPNPQKDAEAIAAAFKNAGFDTVEASYNLTNLDFKRAIRQFEHAASDADIAVVYYAGHGIEIRGTNYLLPVDARLASDEDAEDEAISLDRLVQSADGAKRLRVVILDACRDNPFTPSIKVHQVIPAKPQAQPPRGTTRGIGGAAQSADRGAGLGAMQPTDINTLIAYAAKAGSTAEDGDGDHSPFATALMDNLFVPGLDIRLAFGRVRDEVLKATGNRQEPFVYGSLGGGNISLVSPAVSAQQPAAAAAASAVEDPDLVKADYALVEKIGTKGAWQVFLTQHPNGFYSDLARQQIASLEAPKSQPAGPSAEEQQAWNKIKDSTNPADFRDFAKRYPSSGFAPAANVRADALDQQAQQRAREEALKREEEALRQQLADAKRKAEEEAKQRAAQDAASAKAQQDADAAAAARAQAEREAKEKADAAARQKQLADAALAEQQAAAAAAAKTAVQRKADEDAAAKRKAEQEAAAAAQRKAAQDAALAKAQQEAAAAEAARQQAIHEAELAAQEAAKQASLADAARRQEAVCSDEQAKLDKLQAAGSKAKDDLTALSQNLTCERLRPLVTAALEKASTNTPDQVREAQQQLARLGCYADTADGTLGASTRVAIAHYQSARGKPGGGSVPITDAFVAELKGQTDRVCPLTCSSGKVAKGDQCVVAEEPPPARTKKAKAEKEKERPSKPAHQEAAARPASSSGHSAAIGVGF